MSYFSNKTLLATLLLVGACTTQVGGPGGSSEAPSVDAGIERQDERGPDADLTPPPPPFDGPCGEGDANFETGDGVCFEYFFDTKNWGDAQAACQLLGGDLARIDDDVINGILASLVPSAFPNAWLRGTDAASEGAWSWDGEAMSFSKWRSGEPNNGGGGPGEENCLIIESDKGGTWDDRTCLELNSYLCQR